MAGKAIRWLPLILTLVLLGGTLANAQSTTINACYNNRSGALRYLPPDQKCSQRTETAVSWNQQGAAGQPGTDGTDGLACWDLNGNGVLDDTTDPATNEDIYDDGQGTALDCKGPQGEQGPPANVDELQTQVDTLQTQVSALETQVADLSLAIHSKRVFVSSASYSGAMGGLAGGDANCQALANGAGLLGTFKAWLSDTTGSPATRFTHPNIPYLRIDGVKVADNWADLTDGSLDNAISVTEQGTIGEDQVWTGTYPNGTGILNMLAAECADWTESIAFAYVGLSGSTEGPWTYNYTIGTPRCDQLKRIYCFQQ